MPVVAVAGALLTLGRCAGGREVADDEAARLPPVEIRELTPEAQPFRTATSFADGVLRINVPTPDGPTRTLDTVRDVDWTGRSLLPRPVQPGHASRDWILANNLDDGRMLLHVLASWRAVHATAYRAAG